jgi:TonB family protein
MMRRTTQHLLDLPRHAAPTRRDAAAAARLARRRVAQERRRRLTGLALTAAVALLAHVALVFPLFAAWLHGDAEDRPSADVRVVKVSGADWERNRLENDRKLELERDPERAREDKPPDPADVEEPPGQVVKIAPPVEEVRPQQANYAADYDSSTDRETRARTTARTSLNVTRQPQVGVDEPRRTPSDSEQVRARPDAEPTPPGGPDGPGRAADGNSGTDADNGGGAPKMALEIPGQQQQTGLDLAPSARGDFVNREALRQLDSPHRRFRLAMGNQEGEDGQRAGAGQGDRSGQGARGGSGAEGAPSLAALTPSYRDLERVTGAPANDWLPEIETDTKTALNAWRWKHATFFNRVADGIRRTWAGPELLQKNDPTGEVFGTQELLTIVAVTIDQHGNVVELAVQEPSGADFLDDEALRTFRETGPFTNPPLALFKGEEKYTFTFGFNVSYTKSDFDLNWRPY